MGLLKIFLLFTILLLPLGEVMRLDFGNGISTTANDLGIAILVTIWLISHLIHPRKISAALTKPILFFAFAALLSLFINKSSLSSSELVISSMYLLRWVMYSFIYFIVAEFDLGFKKKILAVLAISAGIFLAIGYVQYIYYQNLKNLFYLGWDDHMYRMFSSFLDPNFTGSFLVLFLLLLFCLFIFEFKKINLKLLFALILTLIAVFLTHSRGALLMLFFGSTILFLLVRKIKLIFVLIGIFMVVFIFLSRYFYIENINMFRTVSTKARLTSASESLKIISDHPVFGVGFNAYRYAQIKYGFRKIPQAITSHADAGTDSSFLFVLATTGIVGFVAYLNIWRVVLSGALEHIKIKKKFEKSISVLLVASLGAIFVNALFVNSLFFPFIMQWMWILIGLRENR